MNSSTRKSATPTIWILRLVAITALWDAAMVGGFSYVLDAFPGLYWPEVEAAMIVAPWVFVAGSLAAYAMGFRWWFGLVAVPATIVLFPVWYVAPVVAGLLTILAESNEKQAASMAAAPQQLRLAPAIEYGWVPSDLVPQGEIDSVQAGPEFTRASAA